MTERHPEVISEDGTTGIDMSGGLLRAVAYYPQGDAVPQIHWVPAQALERVRDGRR